jgi:hypothetical protein
MTGFRLSSLSQKMSRLSLSRFGEFKAKYQEFRCGPIFLIPGSLWCLDA